MDAPSDDDTTPLTQAEAERFLDGVPVVPALAGSLQDMKSMRDRCLAAGIPALVGCPGAASS
jgi:hypothetical protein